MSMPFRPPEWASQPCRVASLQIEQGDGTSDSTPVDHKPYYLFGRDADQCDVVVDHPSASRIHAALVHHTDGRLFIIDLKSTHGTKVDGAALEPHKPTQLKDGAALSFGSSPRRYILRCENSGEKRARGADGSEDGGKRPHVGTVRASHLLVKHRDSRRPSSWKEPVVTRSQEEALEMIKAFRLQIASNAVSFADLASRESHCSSARKGGDLGQFGPGQMQAAFEDATYSLEVGELSGPIFSDSGVHLILRTA